MLYLCYTIIVIKVEPTKNSLKNFLKSLFKHLTKNKNYGIIIIQKEKRW